MMGYDMSWASFHVVEVMSSPKFLYKGIGYLGAVQSFNQETDVLMLTTNLIKKVPYFNREAEYRYSTDTIHIHPTQKKSPRSHHSVDKIS